MPMMRMSDGCALHYRWDGRDDAPVVMFSSSLGYTHAMWDAQVEALGSRFRILRYDSRGHGASDPPGAADTIERLALDAAELIAGLGLPSVNFVGLSIGGMVGMWLCANVPHLVTRVVLANTSAHLDAADNLRRRLALIEQGGMAAVATDITERSLSSAFQKMDPGTTRTIRDMIEAMSPQGYIAGGRAVLGMDLRARLAEIQRPALVIVGALDTATPPMMGERLAAAVPGARLARLEAAHLSNIERATEFNQLVSDFLA